MNDQEPKPRWWEAWNATTTLGRPTNRLFQGLMMAIIGFGLLFGLMWVKWQKGAFVDQMIERGGFPMRQMVSSKWDKFCTYDKGKPEAATRWHPSDEEWTLEFIRNRNGKEQRRWTMIERGKLDVECGYFEGENLADGCHTMNRPLQVEERQNQLCLKGVLVN